ncbi:hypothetical protein O988_09277 [Pseudogymnoascus sp. VKM F-3808]|nr:hypothetical protein O988_09277 [Pseudogymnoascus sp. VKM F-3808]
MNGRVTRDRQRGEREPGRTAHKASHRGSVSPVFSAYGGGVLLFLLGVSSPRPPPRVRASSGRVTLPGRRYTLRHCVNCTLRRSREIIRAGVQAAPIDRSYWGADGAGGAVRPSCQARDL